MTRIESGIDNLYSVNLLKITTDVITIEPLIEFMKSLFKSCKLVYLITWAYILNNKANKMRTVTIRSMEIKTSLIIMFSVLKLNLIKYPKGIAINGKTASTAKIIHRGLFFSEAIFFIRCTNSRILLRIAISEILINKYLTTII